MRYNTSIRAVPTSTRPGGPRTLAPDIAFQGFACSDWKIDTADPFEGTVTKVKTCCTGKSRKVGRFQFSGCIKTYKTENI